jgi:hypothetical protein
MPHVEERVDSFRNFVIQFLCVTVSSAQASIVRLESHPVALTWTSCLEKQLRSREPDDRAGKMCACRAASWRSGRSKSPVWVDRMCVHTVGLVDSDAGESMGCRSWNIFRCITSPPEFTHVVDETRVSVPKREYGYPTDEGLAK